MSLGIGAEHIIRTNVLTEFHEELIPHPLTETIFNLIQDIIKTNVLTKFHEDWTINETFRVKNAPPPRDRMFHEEWAINFHEDSAINPNFLTKFHEDWTSLKYQGTNFLTKFHEDWKTATLNWCLSFSFSTRLRCSHVQELNVDDARRTPCDHKSTP
ncbi:hypothetical protein DPMN_144629 [Dreissena polymorpha]|uniref:Uncharacterized protein n=1 Tax=Dreissena polymorpha TaxID=45954 RepID=A0A9D4J079_DREPO|nr:hypothetical protein DPMN_144629 [Dreissena polymorpha]